MDLDDKLCYCFHISRRKIVNYVKRERPRRASQISECFGAGTGCGWCIPFLKKIHEEIVAGDIVEGSDISAAEYEEMRSSYIADVNEGTRERNRHGDVAASSDPRADPMGGDELFDVFDYFSRPDKSDSEPDPEDLSER